MKKLIAAILLPALLLCACSSGGSGQAETLASGIDLSEVTELSLSLPALILPGESTAFWVNADDFSLSYYTQVELTTSNPAVATVSAEGGIFTVTGVAPGICTISALLNGLIAQAEITVAEIGDLGFTLSAEPQSLALGDDAETLTLTIGVPDESSYGVLAGYYFSPELGAEVLSVELQAWENTTMTYCVQKLSGADLSGTLTVYLTTQEDPEIVLASISVPITVS